MASQRDSEYFKKIIQDVGISLGYDKKSNILTQEPSIVVRDIESKIKCGNINDNVPQFIKGLRILCRKRPTFQKMLTTTILKKPVATGEQEENILQESLMHLFLSISCLQKDIIELILEEITANADDEMADATFMGQLLNAMRYLPVIKEPSVLTQKLLDILDIATLPLQLEILKSIPEIVPDRHSDETAKQVSKLLETNLNLMSGIIDCLNSLTLGVNTRLDIQDDVLDRLARGVSLQEFPILFEFVIIDCKGERLQQTLLKIRDALDVAMCDESVDKEAVSSKVILFDKLYSLSALQKIVYDGWIHLFSTVRDHKPIDYLILFMLHYKSTKRKSIELLFKKRVKAGFFKTASLEVLFQKYIVPQIINIYLPSIIDVATSLLRNTSDISLQEFANLIFKLIFTNPHINRIQRQDIVSSLILLTGSSDSKCISAMLKIFTELKSDPKLKQHTLQLMTLLTEIDMFELKDVRRLFELLCTLTCLTATDNSDFKDELHMLIRKQLTSSKKSVKQRGIIGAVMMVKYMAVAEGDQSDLDLSEESLLNVTDLPRGAPQDSAALLELATTCISGIPELMGLYYDQLSAAIITAETLDKYFMMWLYESVTQEFQEVFVIETIPEAVNGISFQGLYSLNTAEEVEASIHINIGELTIRPSYTKRANIMIMCALFRLVRLLHWKQHNGDLSSIDALLGCSVIMPNSEISDIDSYDFDQIKQITDCIFYCINWFREVISAFVTQKSKKLRLKVIQRLNKLVELEEQLEKYKECVPEHKLPTSYFHNVSSQSAASSAKSKVKITNPRKKFKSSETVPTSTNLNETAATSSSVVAVTQHAKQKQTTGSKKSALVKSEFREMDTDIIILLKYPVKLDDLDETDAEEITTTQQTTISLTSLQFLLKDFNEKLQSLTKNNKNLEMSNLNVVNPADLITDCIKLLPYIIRDFNVIVEKLSDLLESVEGCHDRPDLYTPLANNLKITLALIFEGLSLIFGWTGFKNLKIVRNLNILRDCLKALRQESQSQIHSASHLIKEFINRLYKHVNHCLHLQCAVNLIKTMQILYSINDNNSEIRTKISSASEKLLMKKWYNLQGNIDRGKQAFENIDILTKAYLADANVKTIGGLVATLQIQVTNLVSKDDYLTMLSSIDKSSFHILYRCLCSSLLERVKTEISSLTNNEHLVLWRIVALTMQGLQGIVKAQETRTNLIVFLKKSVGILKVFLSHGMPILEIMLRSKTNEVVEILKIMQTSTRFLHHLCCYSKLNKDLSLLAHVPQFRFILETFVFRVKAALVANNCSEAFWLGNLKNKDLRGEDILTPSISSENNDDRNSDEELPLDDSDEEMVEENVQGEDGSASEIFD